MGRAGICPRLRGVRRVVVAAAARAADRCAVDRRLCLLQANHVRRCRPVVTAWPPRSCPTFAIAAATGPASEVADAHDRLTPAEEAEQVFGEVSADGAEAQADRHQRHQHPRADMSIALRVAKRRPPSASSTTFSARRAAFNAPVVRKSVTRR